MTATTLASDTYIGTQVVVQSSLVGFGLLSGLDLEQELIQVGFNLIVLPMHLHREQGLEIAIPQRKYDFGRFVVIKEIAASGNHGGIIIGLARKASMPT